MDILPNDDKEKETPTGSSYEAVAEDKPTIPPVAVDEEKILTEKLENKKKQLEQLSEATAEETERLAKLRAERRQLASNPISEAVEPDYIGEADDDVKIEAEKIFYKYHPEYSPVNDVGDVNFKKLNEHAKRIKLGSNVAEVLDGLEYIHTNFISKPEAPKPKIDAPSEVADVGIGDTTSIPRQKVPDTLKRRLNEWEQKAALEYPGGESEYRKALVDREKKKLKDIGDTF